MIHIHSRLPFICLAIIAPWSAPFQQIGFDAKFWSKSLASGNPP